MGCCGTHTCGTVWTVGSLTKGVELGKMKELSFKNKALLIRVANEKVGRLVRSYHVTTMRGYGQLQMSFFLRRWP